VALIFGVPVSLCCTGLQVTPALAHFGLRADVLEAQCLAPSTAGRYHTAVLYYVRWLLASGLPLHPCWHYPTEGLLRAYVAFLASTCSAETIKNHLSGLKFYLGYYAKVDWTGYLRLQRELKGIQRSKGSRQQQKRPITMQLLLLWVLMLQADWSSRVQCVVLACVFGVFGMLRRSNLVPGSPSLFAGRKHLRRSDVEFVQDLYALRLTIRETKTLQYGERTHVIYIADSRGAPLDPVRLWQQYTASHPADADSPMFSFFDDAGRLTPLTFSGLAAGIKELVGLVGLDPAQYAAHSLRRGGASGALASGMSPFLTKFQGDWRSECYMRYLTVTKSDMVAITGTMLRQLHGAGQG
jgi:hypothetical protein